MKLYYSPGACSLASHIVLREIGKNFELERVNPGTQKTETGADYTKINPKGYVPTLRLDGDEFLTESAAILQYLADQHPEAGLAPKPGTLERARLQEHLNFIASELHTAFGPLFYPSTSNEQKLICNAKIDRRMGYLESVFSDGRKYLLGEDFSVVDAYFFVVSGWAVPLGIGLDKWPNIAAFSTRVAGRKKVQDAMRAEGLLK